MDRARRKRINRIKRIILNIVVILILVPWILCAFLFFKIKSDKVAYEKLKENYEIIMGSLGLYGNGAKINSSLPDNAVWTVSESDSMDTLSQDQYFSPFGMEALSQKREKNDNLTYRIYLTFDDGPSEITDQVLSILREYNVKATFFVNGREDEDSLSRYRAIVDAGHTIGMHGYSHEYGKIYKSEENFIADMECIYKLIYNTCGVKPVYYRFPGGSSNTVASRKKMHQYMAALHERGIEYIDWNIESGDASKREIPPEQLMQNVFKDFGQYHDNVVLFHDGAGHGNTAKILRFVIERARNMGAELLPITPETVPVQHIKTVR